MKHKHHESLMRLIIMMVDVSEKTFLVNITKYWCYIINDHRWVRVQDYIVCQIEYSVHNSNFIITILVPAGIKSLIKNKFYSILKTVESKHYIWAEYTNVHQFQIYYIEKTVNAKHLKWALELLSKKSAFWWENCEMLVQRWKLVFETSMVT